MVACGQKKEKMPEFFNSLILLQAQPYLNGYLPLEIFAENGEIYVQYIKNGKPLDKIYIVYNHSEVVEYDSTYFFDEIIEDKKIGTYILSGGFECAGYISDGPSYLAYIDKNNDTISYWFDCPIFREDIVINPKDLEEAEKNLLELKNIDAHPNLQEEKYSKNFHYLIHSNPKTLDYPFKKLRNKDYQNIITSDDGNIRIYYLRGLWDNIVQYRTGKGVKDDGMIGSSSTLKYCDDIFTNNIFIKKVVLNNKSYYLMEFAILSGRYNSAECVTQGNAIALYAIEDNRLVKKELFNTGKKTVDEILVEFNVNRDKGEEYHLFKYEDKNKILYVPLVYGDSLTTKYLQYKWDSKYFTYIGIN